MAYSKVLELAAEDRDTGENAQLTFSVVAGDQEQKFYMVSHKQEQRGTLRLKKRLDYERHSEQRFNLTLKVCGSCSKSPVQPQSYAIGDHFDAAPVSCVSPEFMGFHFTFVEGTFSEGYAVCVEGI